MMNRLADPGKEIVGFAIEMFFRLCIFTFGTRVQKNEADWLNGPFGSPRRIGPEYFEAFCNQENIEKKLSSNRQGVLDNFNSLASEQFDPGKVHPLIREFYENTAKFQMDVWSQWATCFKPFAWLLVSCVSRRIEQLNFPVSPLDPSQGLSSEVIKLYDKNKGDFIASLWIRKLVASGAMIYSGFYSTIKLPENPAVTLRSAYPLPKGCTITFLVPHLLEANSFQLVSKGRRFGDPGYYRIHELDKDSMRVWYVRFLTETLELSVSHSDTIFVQHCFKIYGFKILTLHYKIRKEI
jgi:hypothetical protein